MDNKRHKSKRLVIIIVLVFIALILFGTSFFVIDRVEHYKSKTFPYTYLQNFNLSDIDYTNLEDKVSSISDEILSKKIILKYNNLNLEYTLKNLGLSINIDSIVNEIKESQSQMKYNEKILSVFFNKKNVYSYDVSYDENNIKEFLNSIKDKFDVGLQDGRFEVDEARNVKYYGGVDSFVLDVDLSSKKIIDVFNKKITDGEVIELVGTSEKASHNESYKTIDTKVSSFKTNFNPYIVRATNLKSALKHIDGVVIEPGEVFSFYKYAGPYDKKGYVFYYEYVGNGVCQIATTVYNTALLGGLEIVKRYPHAAKSTYVPGGLDATVASYSDGRYVDFQFRNTYKYPIYISAYAVGGEAHVDFWSNSNALEGKSYSTESVKIGYLGYTTYLYTHKDGQVIDKKKIATTWYTKEG